jgi:hypothetical protein
MSRLLKDYVVDYGKNPTEYVLINLMNLILCD